MSDLSVHESRYRSGRRFLLRWLWLLFAAIVPSTGTGVLAQQPEARQAESTGSTSVACTSGTGEAESVEHKLCLGEHITGFGGYDFSGPCDVIAYLTDPREERAARGLLESHIKSVSSECSDQVSLNIRKGEYEFADLHRWGNQASELLLLDEETRIPGANGVMGPFIVDNRVTFFFDPEGLTDSEEAIAEANQALLTHGFDLEAFQLTSNPFLTRSLSWTLLGVSDPCVPVNPPLAVCFDVEGVQASLVDATPTEVLGMAQLQSAPDLVYAFTISWDISVSLEEYANAAIKELPAGPTSPSPSADNVEGYPAIRYDLEPAWAADPSPQPRMQMVLFIDTGSGIASIVGIPNKPGMSHEEIYAGAKRVARILRVQQD